jgi:hypothetical protein
MYQAGVWQLRDLIREWVWAQQMMGVLFPAGIEQAIWPYEYMLQDEWLAATNHGSDSGSGEQSDSALSFKNGERWP